MKKKSKFVSLLFLAVLMLLLTGCRSAAQQDDSTNAYKLPLGENAYMSDMDFAIYSKDIVVDDIETKGASLISTGTYTVSLSAIVYENENHVGKTIKLIAGYYNDGAFVPFNDGEYYSLNKDWATGNYTYSFTVDEAVEKPVLKMQFGTEIDEQNVLNNGGTKKEAKKALKQYRSTIIKINSITIDSNNILVKNYANGTTSEYKTEDLYYYNTAKVSYSTDVNTLTITLNSKMGAWQWIIQMLGIAFHWIVQLVGGYYWLGLIIFTIVLRTAGWPIYAKSNSMSTNMAKVQPELDRINKKYEGKTDQNSKMKQQMETREVMKKNHVSMWGCLLPFLQMPIFLAVYQVVQRYPLTPLYTTQNVNFKFLWTTFAADYGTTTSDWILAILVGITMIASQLLTTFFQKIAQRKRQNFYTAKSQQSNKQMLIMMAVMTIMMVWISWRSAGLAFYWIIGNVYQIGQTAISKAVELKKEDKQQLLSGKVRGRN